MGNYGCLHTHKDEMEIVNNISCLDLSGDLSAPENTFPLIKKPTLKPILKKKSSNNSSDVDRSDLD